MATLNIDLTRLSPELREQLEKQGVKALENALGITTERAASFLELSHTEHPEKDAVWHRSDAIGKFKRFLRKDRKFEGAVDLVWPHLDDYAASVVDAVLSTQEEIPDRPQ